MPPKRAASVAKPASKSAGTATSRTKPAKARSASMAPATKIQVAAEDSEDEISAPAPVKRTKSKITTKVTAKVTTKAKASVKSTASRSKSTFSTAKSIKRKASETEDEEESDAPPPKRTKATKEVSKKRKAEESVSEEEQLKKKAKSMPAKKTAVAEAKTIKKAAAPKKATAPKAPKKVAAPKPRKQLPDLNPAPTKPLHIFVFGEGSQGELGLGHKNLPGKKVIDVTRPRLNAILEALDVVQVAVGGMHCAALTLNNKIYTWGVNDQGALGRHTTQEGKMKKVDPEAEEDSDSDDESFNEDSGLNPAEAEPREVDPAHFPEGTRFASLFAGDSTTFALTTTGLVYGWGTFRGNDGVLGFSKDSNTQNVPVLIPELKQIKTMAVGANHAIAITHKGKAFNWGAGEQSELGRRVVARTATGALVPREFGLQRKNIVDVAAGEHFSMALEKNGNVYAWGHNGYGQCGVDIEDNIDDVTQTPTIVEFLKGIKVAQLVAGNHHSIACTEDGDVLLWGRLDNAQGGMKPEDMPEESILTHEITGRPLAAIKPLTVPNLKAKFVTAANDTSFLITSEGKAYSWGFSTNYQTGQGTSDDVLVATHIDNTAVRGKKLTFAGVGGQFGVLACEKEETPDELSSNEV